LRKVIIYGRKKFYNIGTRSFLIPEFINKGHRVQGAYILDTLINWDDQPDVQGPML